MYPYSFSREDEVLFDKMASAGYEAHGDRHWLAVNKAYVRGWIAGGLTIFLLGLLTQVIG